MSMVMHSTFTPHVYVYTYLSASTGASYCTIMSSQGKLRTDTRPGLQIRVGILPGGQERKTVGRSFSVIHMIQGSLFSQLFVMGPSSVATKQMNRNN